MAMPQHRLSVAGFPPRRPGFELGSGHVDLWWTKWHWGRFSPSTSVPLPILIPPIAQQSSSSIVRGWYDRPIVAAVPSGLSFTPLLLLLLLLLIIIIIIIIIIMRN
jgi:hypothetical protein